MTEQEIIEYLKENKNKGVAFGFMPEEVQIWAKNNSRELCVYCQPIESTEYEWMRSGSEKQWYLDHLYALPEDFKLKEKLEESGWVEFEIDPTSKDFLVDVEKENCNDCNEYYYWFEVERFLRDSVDNDRKYTTFGGWQYKDNKGWFTTPQVEIDNGYISNNYCLEAKPAIPVKIRFWKE